MLDFVVFPPRWLVAEHTFRPPYYHRNTMSEFMGNIAGKYDAKENGFNPGASSLHSCMSGHGPESDVFNKASNSDLKPFKVSPDGLAFMFETMFIMKLHKSFAPPLRSESNWDQNPTKIDKEYKACWNKLTVNFKRE